MAGRIRDGMLILLVGVGGAPVVVGQDPVDTLPAGVTPAAIAAGKQLFLGEGLCMACHGADAKGSLGPNLTDQTWLHGAGTYPEIVARVLSGVPSEQSKLGQIKAASKTELPVVVRGNGENQYQGIMDILDVLGRVGISQIGLATQPPKK